MDSGGPPPKQDAPPGPSAAELALYEKQGRAADLTYELNKDRAAQEAALMPALYKQAGIQLTKNSDGSYSVGEAAKSPEELQRAEIQKLANEREIAALKGELPVDPSVEADIKRGESQVDEELARRGITPGSGDIYARAKSEYLRGANALRYSVRKGEMTSADAIASNRQLELMRKQSQYIDQARQSPGADRLAATSSLFGQAAQPYQADRYKTSDVNQFNTTLAYQNARDRASGAGALVGSGIGAAGTIGSAFLLACWIAEAIYGRTAMETTVLRFWLNTRQHGWMGRIGMGLYRSMGRPFACMLERVPALQTPARWVFDRLLQRAVTDLR